MTYDGALQLELWGRLSTPSLLLLSGQSRPGVVVPVGLPSVCQIELFNYLLYLKPFKCVQTNDCSIVLLVLHSKT